MSLKISCLLPITGPMFLFLLALLPAKVQAQFEEQTFTVLINNTQWQPQLMSTEYRHEKLFIRAEHPETREVLILRIRMPMPDTGRFVARDYESLTEIEFQSESGERYLSSLGGRAEIFIEQWSEGSLRGTFSGTIIYKEEQLELKNGTFSLIPPE